MNSGVYKTHKKDGSVYFRSSFTYKNKHISLGSSIEKNQCSQMYNEAIMLINNNSINIEDYNSNIHSLNYKKWVSIINFRDNNMYFKTPIYIRPNYFEYHYNQHLILKFDVDDLFFYSTHSIMKRGSHYFVADFGMQVNILNKYGIKNYAVEGKDYKFVNGDDSDFRYNNILIINHYNGVSKIIENNRSFYLSKIHINGDFIIGRFSDEIYAAIGYNKAVDHLTSAGLNINYQKNYIDGLNPDEYNKIYESIELTKKIRDYTL